MSFIVCAYATEGTPYTDIAKSKLIPSLDKLNINYDYQEVRNLGNWRANTSYKSFFAYEMLNKHNSNIVLLDVDSEVIKYPKLFDEIPEEYNIGAHILDHDSWYRNCSGKQEFLTGTLFLRNNYNTKALVERWMKRCEENPDIWEQLLLGNLLKDNNELIYKLPISYCYINTLPDNREPYVKCEDKYIIHYQASRELKRRIC